MNKILQRLTTFKILTPVLLGMFLLPMAMAPVRAASVNLEWDANIETDLAGYRIFYATFSFNQGGFISTVTAMGNSNILKVQVNSPATITTINNLTAGMTYFFRMTAYDNASPPNQSGFNVDGSGNDVQISSAIPAPPAAPSGMTGTAQNTNTIRWAWTDNSNNETGFQLQTSTGGFKANIAANATSYDESGIGVNTQVTRRVVAINGAGASAPTSNVSRYTLALAPTGTQITSVGPTVIGIGWTSSGASQYEVEMTVPAVQTLATVGAGVTTYQHTGLPNSTPYTYHVRGLNGDGIPTAFGAFVSATTTSGSDTEDPTVSFQPALPNPMSGTVNLTVVAQDNVAIDRVDFYRGTSSPLHLGTDTTATNGNEYSIPFDSTALSNGSYTFRADAFDSNNNSASVSVTVNVNNNDTVDPLVDITAPAAGNVSGNSVSITVDASDAGGSGLNRVEFSYRTAAGTTFTAISTDNSGPSYSASWNTTGIANGDYVIRARAVDGANNEAIDTVAVTVINTAADNIQPTVSMVPLSSPNVRNVATFTADAYDNDRVEAVQFMIDGANVGPEITSGTPFPALNGNPAFTRYSLQFDTRAIPDGQHTVAAVARDPSDNTRTAASMVILVSNKPESKEAYSFPNPAVGNVDPVIRGALGAVDTVELTIMDQSNVVIHSASLSSASGTLPNGTPFYDYVWTGPKASGVYHVMICGKKGSDLVCGKTEATVIR